MQVLPEAILLYLTGTGCGTTPYAQLDTKTSASMIIVVQKTKPEVLVPELIAGQRQILSPSSWGRGHLDGS